MFMTDNLSKASAPVGFDGLHTSEQKATQLTVSNHRNKSLMLKSEGTYIPQGIVQTLTLEKPQDCPSTPRLDQHTRFRCNGSSQLGRIYGIAL